jgi:hypothetical protein
MERVRRSRRAVDAKSARLRLGRSRDLASPITSACRTELVLYEIHAGDS